MCHKISADVRNSNYQSTSVQVITSSLSLLIVFLLCLFQCLLAICIFINWQPNQTKSFLCNGIRWPLFLYLHQQFTVLIIIFVYWTQLLEYWTHDTNYMFLNYLIFYGIFVLVGIFSPSFNPGFVVSELCPSWANQTKKCKVVSSLHSSIVSKAACYRGCPGFKSRQGRKFS